MVQRHFIFKLCFVLSLFACYSNAADRSIKLVTGLSKPPFVIEETQSGLELDIVKAAFESENIQVEFKHLPMSRIITGYREWGVDGVASVPQGFEYPGMHLSKPYITYENVAVSLANKQMSINVLEDLHGKSVVAFQKARKFLGEDYNKAVSYLIDYREVAEQEKQVELLFSGATEVIILDINIFLYLANNNDNPMFNKEFVVHRIFKPNVYPAGFNKAELKSLFDKGIAEIKLNGTYQALLDKYLNKQK